mgnify:CR=1 FL=1
MELPIDHFRLLGVSPSAEAEEVLRFFQLRLDRIPHHGFTPEVIAQRSELLRRSADLLCDSVMRQEYEAALLKGAIGLEFSTNREVAGLILLWEGGVSYEAFKLAKRALRPPQAPALGSGRESDLTLLAALSCRDAALLEQEQRHYSSAAELLQEGIQLLQRMGKLSEQRNILERDLEALLPYRILDLLSRDLSDQTSHKDGLDLLDKLVLKRGGLEGKKTSSSSVELSQSDFELFFQQIRNFLTAQEQVDLFLDWHKRGSSDAGFLAAIALVASGFYWRKPEALQKARKQLNNLNMPGFDSQPLIGCVDLLLADVQQAKDCFKSTKDKGLQTWLASYPGDSLAALCDYCKNWLQNDVLPGFRDIDNHIVDLEAWFADRDVQEFIEKIERKGALGFGRSSFSFFKSSPSSEELEISNSNGSFEEYMSSNTEGTGEELDELPDLESKALRVSELISRYREALLKLKIPSFNNSNEYPRLFLRKSFVSIATVVFLFLLGTSISFFLIKTEADQEKIEDSNSETTILKKDKLQTTLSEEIVETEKPYIEDIKLFVPLTDENPSKDQIKILIESWLKGKADILSGVENKDLKIVARPLLVKIVQDQRVKDKGIGEREIILAKINSLEIEEQTKKRISVIVEISYRDKRLNASDEIISETIIPSLKLRYILGREKKLWQLVDFSSGN